MRAAYLSSCITWGFFLLLRATVLLYFAPFNKTFSFLLISGYICCFLCLKHLCFHFPPYFIPLFKVAKCYSFFNLHLEATSSQCVANCMFPTSFPGLETRMWPKGRMEG